MEQKSVFMKQDDPLSSLFCPLETLPAVEEKRKSLFYRLMGTRVIDTLLHLPSHLIQYNPIDSILQAERGQNILIKAKVLSHTPNIKKTRPYKVICSDDKNTFEILYFNAVKPYLQKLYPIGVTKIIIGKVDRYLSQLKIVHPDGVFDTTHPFIPQETIYPLTTGITNRCVRRAIHQALSYLSPVEDWLDSHLCQQYGWPQWHTAISCVHNPQSLNDLTLKSKIRQRLAFDEFFSHQLGLQLARRSQLQDYPGIRQKGNNHLIPSFLENLSFELTKSQQQVIQEIFKDMASPHPMSRLIQGDVGSGKTVVALLAMLRAVEAGNQAVILVPTDILARQHAETIIGLTQKLGIRVALLTGREKGKTKILKNIASGEIDFIIGTHAILQEKVEFQKLGLAVIDEQHRFGVEQRFKLNHKGKNPDILAMTATPIPRTLQLTHYGDMDVSVITQKPGERFPIQTKVISLSRVDEVVTGLQRAVNEGEKVFWVCPLVKESEVMSLSTVEERFQQLQPLFGSRVGLLHGQMKAEDKDAVMSQFIHHSIDILIATTVIEVGVHIPAATIMIVEHAECFGLAQLHQLRGRVGRGEKVGTCILLYGNPLSQGGRKRLEIMRETSDGFKIAEADLQLRGGGDVLGTRQSGIPGFKIADFGEYPEICKRLLSLANREAKQICEDDPLLQGPKGEAIRFLLKIFGRDEAMRYTRS